MPVPTARSTSVHGFTLVEMLIVVAIFAIVTTTAVGVLAGVANQKRTTQARIDVSEASAVALSALSLDVANAGYHFPSSAFAVRVTNNVTTTTTLPYTGALDATEPVITTQENCGAISATTTPGASAPGTSQWGLVPGSDVIDLFEGAEDQPVGELSRATGSTVTLGGAYRHPFEATGLNPAGQAAPLGGQVVALFSGSQEACMAKFTLPTSMTFSTAAGSMVFISPQFTAIAKPSGCPYAGQRVFRLFKRSRYMACQTTQETPVRFGLFRQSLSDPYDSENPEALGPPTLVQSDIIDLQVVVRFQTPDPNAPVSPNIPPGDPAINAPCDGQAGSQRMCDCFALTPCTGTDLNGTNIDFLSSGTPSPTAPKTTAASHLQWVKSLLIGVTARSPRTTVGTTSQSQPSLFDHVLSADGGSQYGFTTSRQEIALSNLVSVQQ